MNAFIAAVLEKKTILVANEGRLLKKSFLGIAILAMAFQTNNFGEMVSCLLYTSPSPRDLSTSRMPSSA